MVLLTCPECGGKVSDQATCCPHCGYPISKIEKPIEVRSDVFKYDDTTIVGTESYPYIAIPEGVKSVSESALFCADDVKCIEIPVSLISFYSDGVYQKKYIIYYDGSIDQWTNITFNWIDFLIKIEKLYILDPKGNEIYNNKKYSLVTDLIIKEGTKEVGLKDMCYVPNLRSLYLPKSITSLVVFPSYNKDLNEVYYGGSIDDFLKVTLNDWKSDASLYLLDKSGNISRFGHKFKKAKNNINKYLYLPSFSKLYDCYKKIFGEEHVLTIEGLYAKQREEETSSLPLDKQFIYLINYLENIKNQLKEIDTKRGTRAYTSLLIAMNDFIAQFKKEFESARVNKNEQKMIYTIKMVKEKIVGYEKHLLKENPPFIISGTLK